MHESGLARRLVATLDAAAKERGAVRVQSVKVRLGGVHWVDPNAFQEFFRLFAQGTLCEDAIVEVEEAPPKAICQNCQTTFVPRDHHPVCPSCGSHDLTVEAEPDMEVLEAQLLVPS